MGIINYTLYILHPASFLQSIIYGFDIGKKKNWQAIGFLFVCKCFNTVQTSRIHLPKILIFFFHMLCFLGVRQAEFWLVQLIRIKYEATTTKIHGQVAPKLGNWLIFVSSLGRHTDWVGARIRCNSKIRYKPVKTLKSVISVITKKSVISRFSQIDFQSTGCVPVSSRT